jgi:hypothetical protein
VTIASTSCPRAAPARVSIPRTTIPAIRSAPAAQPPRAMKPRSRSDECTTHKPVRTVIPVGRAGVRGIPIISIRTERSASGYADPYGTNADPHAHLRLRIRQRKHQHRYQRDIFQVTHNHLALQIRSPLSNPGALSNL